MPQEPLELILARNLMSALSTPAFLVDEGGLLKLPIARAVRRAPVSVDLAREGASLAIGLDRPAPTASVAGA